MSVVFGVMYVARRSNGRILWWCIGGFIRGRSQTFVMFVERVLDSALICESIGCICMALPIRYVVLERRKH